MSVKGSPAARVRFGLWIDARNPSRWRRDPVAHFEGLLDQVERAEALGWDEVWLCEQVFAHDGEAAAALPLAAAVAARTERLRIGTGVLPLPLLNPVRVAEDAATLDVLSAGRFDLGVGLGARDPTDAPLHERGERVEEALQILRHLFAGERLAFSGRYFDVPELDLHPRPVQVPLPIWMGGNSIAAARRAGALADGWIGFGAIGEQVETCRRTAAALGRDRVPIAGGLPGLFIARDPERREREAREHFAYQLDLYADWFRSLGLADEDGTAPMSLCVLEPERGAERIRSYLDTYRIERFLSFGTPPGLPHEWFDEHLELMSRDVIPELL